MLLLSLLRKYDAALAAECTDDADAWYPRQGVPVSASVPTR